MLQPNKKAKMVASLKQYKKTYLDKQYTELDESATRLMVNNLLTEVCGYKMIEEIKTEFMIRGTYADYVIQILGVRHFLVEVKAYSLELSEKHLRQAINYAANEGIDWVVLTNGRRLDLYRVLFEKPIECKRVFSIDLTQETIKENVDLLQFLHKDSITKKYLDVLWKKYNALNPATIAGYLFGTPVINYLKRELKLKYKSKFSDNEIQDAIKKVITNSICIDNIKLVKEKRKPVKIEKEIEKVIETIQQTEEKQTDTPPERTAE